MPVTYKLVGNLDQNWKKMCRFKKTHRLSQVLVGFESTGPYAEPLLHFLRQKPVQLVQINPMHSKRVKELTGAPLFTLFLQSYSG
ncbi:MAG: transposase [Desulfobacterales bacterium]